MDLYMNLNFLSFANYLNSLDHKMEENKLNFPERKLVSSNYLLYPNNSPNIFN